MIWRCRPRHLQTRLTWRRSLRLPLTFLPIPLQLKVGLGLSVFDSSRDPIKLTDVERNSVVKAIVRLGYVWTSNSHIGATWQLTQLLVVGPPEGAFVDE